MTASPYIRSCFDKLSANGFDVASGTTGRG